MTQEKENAEEVVDGQTKDESVLPEKQTETPAKTTSEAIEAPEDRNRRAIVFASILLLLLTAPVFLPVERGESFWRLTRREPIARALLVAVFAWPVYFGIVGVIRAWRRTLPGKTLTGVATALTAMQSLATAALVFMILDDSRQARKSPYMWLAAGCVLFAFSTNVRSFGRKGWLRWQFILASMALLPVTLMLAILGTESNVMNEAMEMGSWVFLFGTAALIPFIATTLVSRPA